MSYIEESVAFKVLPDISIIFSRQWPNGSPGAVQSLLRQSIKTSILNDNGLIDILTDQENFIIITSRRAEKPQQLRGTEVAMTRFGQKTVWTATYEGIGGVEGGSGK